MAYAEYFKYATEGLIVVDRSRRRIEANPEAERLFGYSEAELVGQPNELFVPNNSARFIAAISRIASLPHGGRWADRCKDDNEFPVEPASHIHWAPEEMTCLW